MSLGCGGRLLFGFAMAKHSGTANSTRHESATDFPQHPHRSLCLRCWRVCLQRRLAESDLLAVRSRIELRGDFLMTWLFAAEELDILSIWELPLAITRSTTGLARSRRSKSPSQPSRAELETLLRGPQPHWLM